MGKQRVYMMIGLPGSGKDTWIKKNFGENYPYVVSRDSIRVELGMCTSEEKIVGSQEDENLVTNIFRKRLVEYVKEGKDVIINNTNLKRKYRTDLKKILEGYDVEYIYVVIDTPSIEVNIERRKGQIPEDVLRRMDMNFRYPDEDEYDNIIIVQQ